ncbi:LysR family transcriptional regulator [Candidatus Odyssella thessalonicensis]|uniref:LysR family transcriptional regulator n=1 Tax=Candidatus Odyssella thessalonicensis TaxID=84647 RepID=UPI000225C1B3|nr:LysR family transcriptional regulator [Candidatus Odyssella thessalonicensis]
MNLNQLKIFVKAVESRGFSAAARQLHLSATAISKQIKELERTLGVELIQRTTTRFEVTQIGRLFYQQCLPLLQGAENLKNFMTIWNKEPGGELKILSSIAFGEIFIIPHLKQFRELYPNILLTLELADRIPDLTAERLDLCLGLAGHWDANLIQKKLLTAAPVLLAAPSYLERYGEPLSRDNLDQHYFICHSNRPEPLKLQFKEGPSCTVRPSLSVNSHTGFLSCAVDGLGIAYHYDFIAQPLIENGQLTRILRHEPMPEVSYYAFYPPTDHLKPAARVMLDFVVECVHASQVA